MEQGISPDRVADRARVVAQLADLGRGLVDECGGTGIGKAERAGSEEGICRPFVDQARDRRIGEIECVAAHEDVDPRRVTTADLESVDRRERDLDRPERIERGTRRSGPTREVTDGTGAAEAVTADRPERVLHPDELGAEQLELRGGEAAPVVVELGVDLVDGALEISHPRRELGGARGLAEERAHPGRTSQGRIGLLHVAGRIGDRRHQVGRVQRPVEHGGQMAGRGAELARRSR